jgi:hypothetical protein
MANKNEVAKLRSWTKDASGTKDASKREILVAASILATRKLAITMRTGCPPG